MDKPARAVFFSQEEQNVLMNTYELYKDILTAKGNTVAITKAREQCWRKIADSVNACSSVKRSWKQIKTKHKNIHSANKKKSDSHKAGLGPSSEYSSAEEHGPQSVGLPVIQAVQGGVCSYPGPGSSRQESFLEVEGVRVMLLEPPAQTFTTEFHTKVEACDEEESLPLYVDKAVGDDPVNPPQCPEPVATNLKSMRGQKMDDADNPPQCPESVATNMKSTRGPKVVETDSIRTLYKRKLELDCQLRELQMKKLILEIEQLEYNKMHREDQ